MLMHTMRYVEDHKVWEIGYFEPTDDGGESWYMIAVVDRPNNAAAMVNFLNGGSGEIPPLVIRAILKENEK